MTSTPRTWPTFAAELLAARARLGLADEVGLAIRADRQRLGLSQRAYALRRSLSHAMVARLETRAGSMRLTDVLRALEGTEFTLCLCHRGSDDDAPAASIDIAATAGTDHPAPSGHVPVPSTYWPRSELVARVRGGSRRFPAHHTVQQVSRAPLWWWNAEATWAYAKEPNWYAPRAGPRDLAS